LYKVNNILVSAIKNEIILFATEYSVKLFPNSIYHILSVIPMFSKKRSLYTKLIDRSFEKIVKEAIEEKMFYNFFIFKGYHRNVIIDLKHIQKLRKDR